MKFLVDNSLSPRFADFLQAAGHDAAHVRAFGLATADDKTIFDRAAAEGRIIVAQDTDFGTILALVGTSNPSVILFRGRLKSTEVLTGLLTTNLAMILPDLEAGAVVVFEDSRIRIRRLPIGAG